MRWSMRVFVLCFGFAGLGALSSCASSPRVEYFALEPLRGQGPAIASAPLSIQLAQVHLPPTLDRKQMVRHTGSYALEVSDQHRWSAPLDEMIRRVLSQDLLDVLPPGSVVLPEAPVPPGTRKIVVTILEFAPDATGTIQFEGTWSLIAPDSHAPPQSRYVRLSERANTTDTADRVKSMSLVLHRLSTLMAQGVTSNTP